MNNFEECQSQLSILVSNLKEVKLLPKDFSLASSSKKVTMSNVPGDDGEAKLCRQALPSLNQEDSSF